MFRAKWAMCALMFALALSFCSFARADENGNTYTLGPFIASGSTQAAADAMLWNIVAVVEATLPPGDTVIGIQVTNVNAIEDSSFWTEFNIIIQTNGPPGA